MPVVLVSSGSPNNITINTDGGSKKLKQLVLQSITKLSQSIPLTTENANNKKDEEILLSIVTKECIPGRDDTGKEINPTTHRKRECLRHVPLVGKDDKGRQRPRIGIMINPGYISIAVAKWISQALQKTGDSIHNMKIDILVTSHVPVYGYGKSHGYSKLIRLAILPLPLAMIDAYYYSMNELLIHDNDEISNNGNNEVVSFAIQNLDVILDESKVRNTAKPTALTVEKITQLLLRWHCRLSHVAAHTAELTLTLDNLLRHPTDTLDTILAFVWRQDWEWGEQNDNQKHTREGDPPKVWKSDAEAFVASDVGSLQPLLSQLSILLQDDGVLLSSSTDTTFVGETLRQSFAKEMINSNNLSIWPCTSFWDGVEVNNIGGNNENKYNNYEDKSRAAVYKIANEMTPNCRDGDLYAHCTVNKDRCEVKKEAKCK